MCFLGHNCRKSGNTSPKSLAVQRRISQAEALTRLKGSATRAWLSEERRDFIQKSPASRSNTAGIGVGKVPTTQQGDLHRAEIAGADNAPVDQRCDTVCRSNQTRTASERYNGSVRLAPQFDGGDT
jgi:hypothetical protein